MKSLPIIWQRLTTSDEKTCDRCDATYQELQRGVKKLTEVLGPLGIGPTLEAREIDEGSFRASPSPALDVERETIRTMLRSETYKGVMVHGRTKSITRGGNTQVRVHVSEKDLIVTPVPDMKIVEPELWDRARARKTKTKARYMRAPNGTLLGKPESGLMAARCLLTGFLRCSICGGGMTHMRKNNRAGRYYCIERSRRGSSYCSNSQGIPMKPLDDAVLLAINEVPTDEDQMWDLITERVARWKREHVEGLCNLSRLVSNKGVSAPSRLLPPRIARAKPALEAVHFRLAAGPFSTTCPPGLPSTALATSSPAEGPESYLDLSFRSS